MLLDKSRTGIAYLATAVALSAFALAACASPEVQKAKQDAARQARASEEAMSEVESAENCQRADLYAHEGLNLLQSDKTDEAIEALQKAVSLCPQSAQAHKLLGTAYGVKGNWMEAEKSARKSTELKADDWQAWNTLGSALFGLGRYKEAAEALDSALNYVDSQHRDVVVRNRDRVDKRIAEGGSSEAESAKGNWTNFFDDSAGGQPQGSSQPAGSFPGGGNP